MCCTLEVFSPKRKIGLKKQEKMNTVLKYTIRGNAKDLSWPNSR